MPTAPLKNDRAALASRTGGEQLLRRALALDGEYTGVGGAGRGLVGRRSLRRGLGL